MRRSRSASPWQPAHRRCPLHSALPPAASNSPPELVRTALELHGRPDILVNNAGIIQVGPAQTTEAEDYETALNTMALAPERLALAALPVMRGQQHGRIVNIASIGGKVSVPH